LLAVSRLLLAVPRLLPIPGLLAVRLLTVGLLGILGVLLSLRFFFAATAANR